MPRRSRIRKGDQVVVISGGSAGVKGTVLRVLPGQERVIVEKANMRKFHTRPNPQAGIQGGILEREAPVHISNVQLICPQDGVPTRIGRVRLGDGKVARVSKKSGAQFD